MPGRRGKTVTRGVGNAVPGRPARAVAGRARRRSVRVRPVANLVGGRVGFRGANRPAERGYEEKRAQTAPRSPAYTDPAPALAADNLGRDPGRAGS